MKLHRAIVDTLRSKRVWEWEVGGAILYSIPVAIRFVTKSVYIPILGLPGIWIDHYIPGNLVEKILLMLFSLEEQVALLEKPSSVIIKVKLSKEKPSIGLGSAGLWRRQPLGQPFNTGVTSY
jgi:hypothetical protein